MDNPIDDEFFVIDSNNLNQTTTGLYGYVVNKDGLVSTAIEKNEELTPDGAYVFIEVSDDKISIYQDFIGSYGLYLFQDEDYFAISNSFVKLVDYIKSNHEISLNRDYANDFLFASLTTSSYGGTLVNEISFLPRNYIVNIDKTNNEFDFDEINYDEHSISLNSKEGIEILDNWYFKWINIIRNIKTKTNNLCFELSGGFDSRMLAALWLSAGLDLDDIKVISIDDDLHSHAEDYEIASQIADHFNFELNKGKVNESKAYYNDIEAPLMNSFNVKLGFHKQMHLRTFRYDDQIFTFTGFGGELVRGFYNTRPSDHFKTFLNSMSYKDYPLIESSLNIYNSAFSQISDKYDLDIDSVDLFEEYGMEVRCRHHFGKGAVETYMSNEIYLTPLIDSDLYKLTLHDDICRDKQLLMVLIFIRYCPDLLNFKFEGNRGIDDKTIEYAKKINERFPSSNKEFDDIATPPLKTDSNDSGEDDRIREEDINNFLEEIFNSRAFEMEFKKYFSFKTYNEIYNIIKNTKYYPLKSVYSAIAVLKIAKDVEISQLNKNNNEIIWLNSFLNPDYAENIIIHENKAELMKFATARIDIKNYGEKNNIEIIENSDDYSIHYNPDWFSDKSGYGWIVETYKGSIDLKIRCINKGKLKVFLRSNFWGENGRFPIFINYTNFTVNGKGHFSNIVCSHDEPFTFEKEVDDGEILEIHVEWNPVNKSSVYIRKDEQTKKEPNEKDKPDDSSSNKINSFHNKFNKLKNSMKKIK
ncbi:hypothetical protein [Methanobrevibacter sp.]|uniref:hypothetical protein n=1 Tax=Methanobrevibacter sp. TaxID=66852 RepID=UPI00388E3006